MHCRVGTIGNQGVIRMNTHSKPKDKKVQIRSLNMRAICLVISVMLGMGLRNSPNHEHHGDHDGQVKREAEVGQGFGDDPG